jgi:hypothetical protein
VPVIIISRLGDLMPAKKWCCGGDIYSPLIDIERRESGVTTSPGF